jgi:serine protease Do
VQRGWLGVQIQPVTPEIAESLGLTGDKGALVSNAQDESPAKKAGVVAGDVITAVDGKDVASPRELARIIASISPGKPVDVTLWRNGKSESVKVDLGEFPTGQQQAAVQGGDEQAPAESDQLADLGLTITPSDDGKGVVVTSVDPDSDAASRGIQAGDVITNVNSKPVTGSADIEKAMQDAAGAGRKAVLVQVTRDSASRFVTLPVTAKG